MKNPNNDNSEKISLEDHIDQVLRKKGFLFPASEEEIKTLLESIEKDDISIPSSLKDKRRIYKESSKSYIKKNSYNQDSIYSLAARQGGRISEETLNKILSKKSGNDNPKKEN